MSRSRSSTTPVAEENVIGETIIRATAEDAGPVTPARIAAPAAPADYADLVRDPLASWVETAFGLDRDDEGKLARRVPTTVQRAARDLAAQAGADEDAVREGASSAPCRPAPGPGTRAAAGRCSRSGCTSSCPRATPCT